MKRDYAFTLAEVLITLGIIGVVAAMTMPTLIQNQRKKVLHTAFLKTYSDLNNASKRFEIDNDISVYQYSYDGASSTDTLNLFMKSFVSVSKGGRVASEGSSDADHNISFQKVLGFVPTNLKGDTLKTHPCDQSIVIQDVGSRIFSMDDPVSAYDSPTKGPKICVDTNGKKLPNVYGYDWFVFIFTPEGNVKPYIGANMVSISPTDMADPSRACSYSYNAPTYTCAYYALQDVNPHGEGTYWNNFLRKP